MSAYYNEWETFPAQWLRNLSGAGLIAPGAVDERSIASVAPEDVRGATQAHFFAGIGVWSYALRLAGWEDSWPVWTGSCPCQPFSQAGRGKGIEDDRHLWPEWYRLIKECRPPVIFGEQAASPATVGRASKAKRRPVDEPGQEPSAADSQCWIDAVQTDLERAGYTVGFAVFPAAGVGAPHQRHRLYFVAHSEEFRRPARGDDRAGSRLDEAWEQFERHGDARGVADAYRARFAGQPGPGGVPGAEAEVPPWVGRADGTEPRGATLGVADAMRAGRPAWGSVAGGRSAPGSSGAVVVADADGERLEGERLQLRERGPQQDLLEAPRSGEARELGDSAGGGWRQDGLYVAGDRAEDRTGQATQQRDAGQAHELADATGGRCETIGRDVPSRQSDDGRRGGAVELGDAGRARGGGHAGAVPGAQGEGEGERFAVGGLADEPLAAGAVDGMGDAISEGLQEQLRLGRFLYTPRGAGPGQAAVRAGSPLGGFWTDAVWLYCRDGLYRPTEPRLEPLPDGAARLVDWLRPLEVGVEGRVGKIKAFGNAINSLQAASFLRSFIEVFKMRARQT